MVSLTILIVLEGIIKIPKSHTKLIGSDRFDYTQLCALILRGQCGELRWGYLCLMCELSSINIYQHVSYADISLDWWARDLSVNKFAHLYMERTIH